MKELVENYLRLGLILGLIGSALWTLVVLFGALGEGLRGNVTAALGVVICFIGPFVVVLLVSGVYDLWKHRRGDDASKERFWFATAQRERLGFILMAGSLLLLISAITIEGVLLWLVISGVMLFVGGAILAITSIQEQRAVWRRRSATGRRAHEDEGF